MAKEVKPTIDPKYEQKIITAYANVEVEYEKIKLVDGVVVVTIDEALTAKQYGRLKSIGGKKGELVQRGEKWLISYA